MTIYQHQKGNRAWGELFADVRKKQQQGVVPWFKAPGILKDAGLGVTLGNKQDAPAVSTPSPRAPFPPEIAAALQKMVDKNNAVKIDKSTTITSLVKGYRMTAKSEGKAEKTIEIVETAVRDLDRHLRSHGKSVDIKNIGVQEIREYLVDLSKRRRFSSHRFTPQQVGRVSETTVNGYGRALSTCWAWLKRDGWVVDNPFDKIRLPKVPKKEIEIMNDEELRRLFGTVDTSTPEGFRDYVMMSILLDTAVRNSELGNLTLEDIDLERHTMKILKAKGNKPRTIPFGLQAQKLIWTYEKKYRFEPALPRIHALFLNEDGRPITTDRLAIIVRNYGEKAGIKRVKVHPHLFRHTALTIMAKTMDVFNLQKISGHASVESLSIYVHMAQSDLIEAHGKSSPLDNIDLPGPQGIYKKYKKLKSDSE